MTRIFGIVNLTDDSFSEGGRWREPDAAIRHARALHAAGADVIDLGAESTHPDARDVSADEELRRLAPVVESLRADGIHVSIDTRKPEVMRTAGEWGVGYLNDVNGFRDPAALEAAAACEAQLVVMHSISPDGRARRTGAGGGEAVLSDEAVLSAAMRFFESRLVDLERAGIERRRVILDPGMGFFLGEARHSLAMLRNLQRLRAFGRPLLISTSRKSFIGSVLADADGTPRPVDRRGAGTLASELWAARQGVDFIRTHDVGALRDGLRVLEAIHQGT